MWQALKQKAAKEAGEIAELEDVVVTGTLLSFLRVKVAEVTEK